MKRLLLLMCICICAVPAMSQEKLHLKDVFYLDYSNIKPEQRPFVGGFSSIEYIESDSSWRIVSDRDQSGKRSYIYKYNLTKGFADITEWKGDTISGLVNVESYRRRPLSSNYFAAIENDGNSEIVEIDGNSIKSPGFISQVDTKNKNRGIEALTFMPGSNDLWYALESGESTTCERDSKTTFVRVPFNSIAKTYGKPEKYSYLLDRCTCLAPDQTFDGTDGNGVSEILAYDQGRLLILERCYNSKTGVNQARIVLGKINTNGKGAGQIVEEATLFDFNKEAQLVNPGNLEGMTWGPDDEGAKTLYLISDDNNDCSQQTRLIVLSEKSISPQNYKRLATAVASTPTCEFCGSIKVSKDENNFTTTDKNRINSDGDSSTRKAGFFCRLLFCLCIKDSCKPKIVSYRTPKVTFSALGNIISTLPTLLVNSEYLTVSVAKPTIDHYYESSLGKVFEKSINRLQSGTSQDSIIVRQIGFETGSVAAKFVDIDQFAVYKDYFKSVDPYIFELNGKANSRGKNDTYEIRIENAKDERARQKLKFIKRNVDNMFIRTVFEASRPTYAGLQANRSFSDSLFDEYYSYATRIEQLRATEILLEDAKASCNCSKYNGNVKKIRTELCSLLAKISLSQTQLCALAAKTIEKNKCWMRSWLWYTDGIPKLNPFGKVSTANFYKVLDRKIAVYEAQLHMYQYFVKFRTTDAEFNTVEKDLKVKISKLAAILADLKHLKGNQNISSTEEVSWLNSFTSTSRILNEVLLYSNDQNTIHWMNHFDAKDDFHKLNIKDSLPDRIFEKDVMHGLVHNLTSKQKVSSKEYVVKTELKTEFSVKVEPFADAFGRAIAAMPNLKNSKLGKSGTPDLTVEESKANQKNNCDREIALYESSKVLIDWLASQTEPPLEEIEAAYKAIDQKELSPVYRSQEMLISDSRSAEGSNIVSYEIFEEGKDKPLVKDKYQTYNTVHFWPFVSVNYVFGSRASTVFDQASNTFKAYTEMDNIEVFAGAKWFFGPSNVTRTPKRSKFMNETVGTSYRYKRGNSFGGKSFVFLGLGIRHKFLKNYGLGAGFDIVPGLGVNGGVNIYFDKRYELVNGVVRRDFDVPRFRGFFGLSIDANVVTQLISLF